MCQMKGLDFELEGIESRFLCQKFVFETITSQATVESCIYLKIVGWLKSLMRNFVRLFSVSLV